MGTEKYINQFRFEEKLHEFDRGLLFQNDDMIMQHPFLNKIYPYALNTIHLVTYCENNTVSLLSGSLEIGTAESISRRTDEIGGISCGIDHEGNLRSYAYDLNTLEKISKHPQTRFVFAGSKIPHFDHLKSFAIHLHLNNRTDDVISWKLALDSSGQAILLHSLMEKENLL